MRTPRAQLYHEPARTLSVLGQYDVLVCGGGPSGCAAALAASRHGARTLLLEREGYLGGAPATQCVTSILSTNAMDFQGIWHEWARRLRRFDGISAIRWEARCGTHWLGGSVNPEAVKMAWQELLAEADVDVLYFAQAASAIMDGNRITGAIIECRGGRQAIFAKRVIDTTGNGEVCAAAGAHWDQGVDGKPWAMGVSLNAWYGGIPVDSIYQHGRPNTERRIGRSMGSTPLFSAGLLRILRVDPLDPWAVSRAMQEGREQIWKKYWTYRERWPGLQAFLAGTSAQPGVRSSRRVHGLVTMTDEDAMELRKYTDSIARASWEIDIHPADRPHGKGIEHDDPNYIPRLRRTEAGDYFDIRYGALVVDGVDNLLMAGRCIAATHIAQASLRIQQTCMATGQAAGTAAALSIAADTTPREMDPSQLVQVLAVDRTAVTPFADIQDREHLQELLAR